MKSKGLLVLLGLHLLLGVYSFSDVFSKFAAGTSFGSVLFFVFYGLVLVLLAIYALGWQQVIKRIPLTSAYANRAVTIIWGMLWGVVFFGESITLGKLVGAAIIMSGIVLFAMADKAEQAGSNASGETDDITDDGVGRP